MKRLLLSTLLFCFGVTALMAQLGSCKPDPKYKDSLFGVFPRPYDPVSSPKGGIDKSACIGKPYQFVFTGVVPDTLTVNQFGSTFKLKVDSLKIDKADPTAVEGLPKGLNWDCGTPNCLFKPKNQNCVVIFGTATNANAPKDYDLKIKMKAYLQSFLGPITYDISFPDPSLFPGKYTLKLEPNTSKTCYVVGNEDQYINVDKVNIFPNPATDVAKITFSAQNADRFDFILTDLNGRVFRQEKRNVAAGWNEFNLDCSNLADGMYIYYIGNEKGKIANRLMIGQ